MTETEMTTAAPGDDVTLQQWVEAVGVLAALLKEGKGVVSSRALRSSLEKKGFANARQIVIRLKYYDFDSTPSDELPRPDVRWYSHAKSIYSEEAFAALRLQQDQQAASAEKAEAESETSDKSVEEEGTPAAPSERRRNRQEEGRLGAYVLSALQALYESDVTPESCEWAFDVHNDRAGSDYENVDLIAVHWRSEQIVEIVTVEVKLDFTARLVQQAKNYTRFSDRVWIAVPVLADTADISAALREFDPLLFEHVIEAGLGILACRRRRGAVTKFFRSTGPDGLSPTPWSEKPSSTDTGPVSRKQAQSSRTAGSATPSFSNPRMILWAWKESHLSGPMLRVGAPRTSHGPASAVLGKDQPSKTFARTSTRGCLATLLLQQLQADHLGQDGESFSPSTTCRVHHPPWFDPRKAMDLQRG